MSGKVIYTSPMRKARGPARRQFFTRNGDNRRFLVLALIETVIAGLVLAATHLAGLW